MSDPGPLEVVVSAAVWSRLGSPQVLASSLDAALAALADRDGDAPRACVVTRSAAADALPVELRLGGRLRAPSTSSWIRISAAVLGRFPRTAELRSSVAGALLDDRVAIEAVVRGLTEVCLDVVHRSVIPPWEPRDPASRGRSTRDAAAVTLALEPTDFVALFHVSSPEAIGAEVARLVWEATGVPSTLRFDVHPDHRKGEVGVTIGGIAEPAIPLLPDGMVLDRQPAAAGADDRAQIIPTAGNAFWCRPAQDAADAAGTIDRTWTIALCLFDLLRERAPRLLDDHALDRIHDAARAQCPQSLAAAIQRLSLSGWERVVHELVRDGAPVADLRTLCGAITELVPPPAHAGARLSFGSSVPPQAVAAPGLLGCVVPYVRLRLGARIVAALTSGEPTLRGHLLSRAWKHRTLDDVPAADADDLRRGLRAVSAVGFGGASWRIAVLAPIEVRGVIAALARHEFPHVSVVAYEEIPEWVAIQPLSRELGAPRPR